MSGRPRYPVTVCLLVGGPERVIEIDGRDYPFEYTHGRYGGPIPLTKAGADRELGPRHKFWTAVSHWIQQGMKMRPDGKCAWEVPPDPLAGAVRVGRRTFVSPEIAKRLGLGT